jgi:hypothetical protein
MAISFWQGYAWSKWLYGLVAAGIGGGASAAYGALSVTIVDPKDFNPSTSKFYQVAALMFGFGALTSFMMYLKEHPVPDLVSSSKHESTTVEQLQGTGDGSLVKTVVSKVEEKVEVKPPAK